MLQYISQTVNETSRTTVAVGLSGVMMVRSAVSVAEMMTKTGEISAREQAVSDATAVSGISTEASVARTRCVSETETADRATSRNALLVRWNRHTMNLNWLTGPRKAVLPLEARRRYVSSSLKVIIR